MLNEIGNPLGAGFPTFALARAQDSWPVRPDFSNVRLADLLTQWGGDGQQVLNLPNPYTSQPNAPVHPSLVYVAEGWNGYRWWLAYTPYPGADSAFENPCVAASNDMVTWAQPARNPIIPQPGGATYNADTHLALSPDSLTLYMLYRVRGNGVNRLMVVSTRDGKNWSSPLLLLSGAMGTQDYASPSIWWNGTGWTLITHNLDAASPWPMERRVSLSANMADGFGSAATVTLAPAAGRAWWHTCMIPAGLGGRVIGLAMDNSGSPGASGDLYYVESSDDGLTWSRGSRVSTIGGKYRSALALRHLNGKVIADILVGTIAGVITYSVASAGRINAAIADESIAFSAIGAGTRLPSNVAFADSAIRADSAVTPNPASCGLNWTVSSGTWGITGNKLYPVASGRLLFDTGVADHRISTRLAITNGVQQWVIVRALSSSTYYRVGMTAPGASDPQTLAIQDILGGAVQSTTVLGQINNGDRLTLEATGGLLVVLVNGQVIATTPIPRNITATSVGLQANGSASLGYYDVAVTKL